MQDQGYRIEGVGRENKYMSGIIHFGGGGGSIDGDLSVYCGRLLRGER